MQSDLSEEEMKKSVNLINNCMLFAFKQIDDKYVFRVLNPGNEKRKEDDLFLVGLDREGSKMQFSLVANLLDAATQFYEQDQQSAKRII